MRIAKVKLMFAVMLINVTVLFAIPGSALAREESGSAIGWSQAAEGQWRYYQAGGNYLAGEWRRLDCQGSMKWYHFDRNGYMTTGWYQDVDGRWYYFSEESGAMYGTMQTGWLVDQQDGNWYYLYLETGFMATGWTEIDGHSYFFNDNGAEESGWRWDKENNCWIYNERGQKPLGSAKRIPDGESY